MNARMSVPLVKNAKGKRKLAMLTAYDFPSARLADGAGADIILVGDSLGMVVLGHDDTLGVTVETMIHHTAAVRNGVDRALIVGDMPWMSYHVSREATVENAAKFIRAGAQAVKIEGGRSSRIEMVRAILDTEIPVMGHVGLTPQSVNALGGFKVQGKGAEEAARVLEEAIALDEAGCFAVVLECVPSELAALISKRIQAPTIGIGAGPECDGQVLVYHDVLGLYDGHTPRFVRQYADIGDQISKALTRFVSDVRDGSFPSDETESFHVADESELSQLYGEAKA